MGQTKEQLQKLKDGRTNGITPIKFQLVLIRREMKILGLLSSSLIFFSFTHAKDISLMNTWKPTNTFCEIGNRLSCPGNTICSKIDASKETKCGELLEAPPIIFLFPFDRNTSVICTQSPENPNGTHGFKNMLFAIDLATPYSKPASTVRASADGKAFVFDQCKIPKGKPAKSELDDCGLGLGNHIRILHEGGYVSFYVHLEKSLVKTGDNVKAGQGIGVEGWTGQAGHRHLHWDVNKLGGNTQADWEKILSNPGWGGISVPYYFRVVINEKEQVVNSKDIKCKHDDMNQKPWKGAQVLKKE